MAILVVAMPLTVWQPAARMTRQRPWQTIGFLALVALLFVVATIRDEVRDAYRSRQGASCNE